jgi:hypothetical protein
MASLPPVEDDLLTVSAEGDKRKGYNIYINIIVSDTISNIYEGIMFHK